jgi:hypothetical protein
VSSSQIIECWDTPLPEEQERASTRVPPVPLADSGCDRPWDSGARSLDVVAVAVVLKLTLTMMIAMLKMLAASLMPKGVYAARAGRDELSEREKGFRPAAQQLSLMFVLRMLRWNCSPLT